MYHVHFKCKNYLVWQFITNVIIVMLQYLMKVYMRVEVNVMLRTNGLINVINSDTRSQTYARLQDFQASQRQRIIELLHWIVFNLIKSFEQKLESISN